MAYTTINKPSEYFNTKLYTGNGSTNAITGVGFQPDLIWSKNRGAVSNHFLVDVIRGTEEELRTNSTNHSAGDGALMDSIDSDGFTLSTSASMNTSSANYVSWNWLANGAGVSNTDGDITSTVSASTTSGFSIVKWTGTGSDGTIGHGLGVAPKMVIVKSLANTTAWMVYHASLGNAQEIYLNSSSGSGASTAWNSTTPTYNVISLDGGAGNGVNASGDYIAYVFAEKKGFSKFGSYTGNGNADGPFIYTGFKPAFVITKRTDAAGYNWSIWDNKRDSFNLVDLGLSPNTTSAEYSEDFGDFLSNGFKIRGTNTNKNEAGGTYIYMAFAEEPLVGTNNIPATAR
jgi:hypothetical protein